MGASNSRQLPVLQKCTEGGENARIKYAASSMQGWRPYMEDYRAAVPDLDDLTSFFGVYDGHGGADVALLCARQFHTELRNHEDFESNLPNAMRSVFYRMDQLLEQSDEWKELLGRGSSNWIQFLRTGVCANHCPFKQATPYIAPQDTGSTACVAAIRGHQIIVGNVGDSRCIVSRNGRAIGLSIDHKPSHRIERQRIERAGGRVIRDKVLVRVGQLLFREQVTNTARINGRLAVSRVIGDFAFKCNKDLPPEEQMATCDPGFRTMNITNDIEFLVIGSDGIWDYLKNQTVVTYVRNCLRSGMDLRVICENICDSAMRSRDNTTVIVVQFKDASTFRTLNAPRPPPLPPMPEEEEERKGGDPETSEQKPLLDDQ